MTQAVSRLPQRLLKDGWWLDCHLARLSIAPRSDPKPAKTKHVEAKPVQVIRNHSVMSITAASDIEIKPMRPLVLRLATVAACAALADWLFYGWSVGVSLPLFLGLLAVAAVGINHRHAPRHIQSMMAAILAAALAALIEDINLLSVMLGLLATVMSVVIVTADHPARWYRHAVEAILTVLRGPLQFAMDMVELGGRLRQTNPGWLKAGSLATWFVPVVASATFLMLFASANPLIERGLMQIDLSAIANIIDAKRIVFWITITALIWSLLRWRSRRRATVDAKPSKVMSDAAEDMDRFFGARAVLRSLILFNALFAVQTLSDVAFLWGGVNLPAGITHAQYAHRGAYPLIVTALLAAAFVLVAMRRGGPAKSSRWIRPLVLVWTAQNVALVISSILRLELYVAAYSLTYWRLAAGIWMALVAIGLVLILLQIWLRKPISWLIAANMLSLVLVLYGCCFLNAPRAIAFFNLAHCHEIDGNGPNLDLDYLASLGPQALPAIEAYMERIPMLQVVTAPRMRAAEASATETRPTNWRMWGFRDWRLRKYLADHPLSPSLLSPSLLSPNIPAATGAQG